MPNIYTIREEFRDLMRRIDDCEGELTPELAAEIDLNESDFTAKAEAYACVIREKVADAAAIHGEIARLQALEKSCARTAARLHKTLAAAIWERGGSLSLPMFQLSAYRTASVVVNVPAQELPMEFQRPKVTIEPDKVKIRAALSGGIEVPGCSLAESISLRIR